MQGGVSWEVSSANWSSFSSTLTSVIKTWIKWCLVPLISALGPWLTWQSVLFLSCRTLHDSVYELRIVVALHVPTPQYVEILADRPATGSAEGYHPDTSWRLHETPMGLPRPADKRLWACDTDCRAVGRVLLHGDLFVVNGLLWDKKQGDYCIWYYAQGRSPQPTHAGDEAIHHTNFQVKRGGVQTIVAAVDDQGIVWQMPFLYFPIALLFFLQ
jgi:hypothetical protein